MNLPLFFEAKNTNKLFGLEKDFNFLINLHKQNKLPKISLFSGRKGSGKSTLINHFLFSIFDIQNYDLKKDLYLLLQTFLTNLKMIFFQI